VNDLYSANFWVTIRAKSNNRRIGGQVLQLVLERLGG